PTLQPAAVGQPYALRLYPTGGAAPFHWSTSEGALPPGLTLADDGMLTGTPTTAGAYSFTASTKDAASAAAQAALTLRVDDVSAPFFLGADPTKVVRAATPRIGLNVFDQRSYWTDVGLTNMLLANPGFEPQPPLRRMYLAQTGDASSVACEPLYDGASGDFPTGTFDGGKYWILSGPAKGRTGTVKHFTRTEGTGGQFTGAWTFDDSNASAIVRTATTVDPLDADIFMVEEPAQPVLPGWGGRNLGTSATVSADSSVHAAGTQSARLDSTAAADVAVSQTFLLQNTWARLRADTTYGFSVDVRQHGLASGQVHVRVGTPFPKPAFFDQSFAVPDDGQFHHLSGTFVGGGQADAAFDVAITDAGTAWVDDAMLWEAQATTTSPHGPASAPVASQPFEPLPYVVQDLRDAQVGCVRVWYYDTDLTLADALRRPTADDPAPAHNLYGDLNLAETIGAKAWIVAAKEWTTDEFVQLAEYLASPDTTQGMGLLRAQQGHPQPWTDTLAHVYIEYSDEAWNWPNFAYPYDMWHPSKYGEASTDRFGAIKASPYYTNMTLVLDGQARDDYWVNQPLDKLVYPAHDAMDNAPYVQASTAWPASDVGSELLGQYAAFAHDLPATLAMFQAQGHATKLLVYEGGP
ncbi:MAG TPA: Ig domain-containing protein, partial [Polyangiaceae bacterium]